jgi:hypothetical protein
MSNAQTAKDKPKETPRLGQRHVALSGAANQSKLTEGAAALYAAIAVT